MIYYIHPIDKNIENNLGVNEKVHLQVDALNDLGVETKLIQPYREGKWKRGFPFSTSSADWNNIKIEEADGLYIRYSLSDYQFIKFLRKFKKNDYCRKIVIEIPTFPYDKELKRTSITTIRDRLYRDKMRNCVDRIAIVGRTCPDTVFGVKTIRITNGIDVEKYKVSNRKSNCNELNLISVSNFGFWHGIDRMIQGMRNYYDTKKNCKVVLHLVGGGTVIEELKKKCNDLGIEEYVHFYGYKTGAELDSIYDIADIGIDALACHRKGIKGSSSLKSREYMARGLPFIHSVPITGLDDEMKMFRLKIDDDESDVDIDQIVSFFKTISSQYKTEKMRMMIRNNAKSTIDIRKTMMPIADFFKN